MAAQRKNFFHLTFNVDRAFQYDGAVYFFPFFGCQVHFGEFVHISAASDAAEITGISQVFGDQIDDKFSAFLNQLIGVTLGTNGNVSHGGIGIDGASPCHGDDVWEPSFFCQVIFNVIYDIRPWYICKDEKT